MGLAIGGRVIPTPFRSVCYLEDARYRADPGSDLRRRAQGTRVRGIVLHATQGNPTFVNPGTGPADRSLSSQGLPPNAGAWFQVWRNSPTQSSSHIVVDWDGTVYCGADLLTEAAYHATIVNEWTIGIELHVGFGDNDATCYAGQLAAWLRLIDFLTRYFGIPRVYQESYHGTIDRIISDDTIWGIFGHRDVDSAERSDPGDLLGIYLGGAGYKGVDFYSNTDLVLWKSIQSSLGVAQTGWPDGSTVAALRRTRPAGMIAPRPGDTNETPGAGIWWALAGAAALVGGGLLRRYRDQVRFHRGAMASAGRRRRR